MATESVKYSVDIILPLDWWEVPRYRLQEDITISGITVPKGFVTDGATVPRPFWFMFPPIDRYFGAAVVHDFLLETGATWPTANREFNRILKELKVRPWRRWMMVAAVKLYGSYREGFHGD